VKPQSFQHEEVSSGTVAQARTSATRWGTWTQRWRAWAASNSLWAIAGPALRLPARLVVLVHGRIVAKMDSMALVVRRWILRSAGYQ
jgi:hypothetical protein